MLKGSLTKHFKDSHDSQWWLYWRRLIKTANEIDSQLIVIEVPSDMTKVEAIEKVLIDIKKSHQYSKANTPSK